MVLRALRVSPYLGRTFVDAEGEIGADQVVVLSYELRQDCFDSDPQVVGRILRVSGQTREVIGVMPPGFKVMTDAPGWNREYIGFVFQAYRLLDDLTVYENLDIPLSCRNVPGSKPASFVADILDCFSIVAKKDLYPSQLSGVGSSNSSRWLER